ISQNRFDIDKVPLRVSFASAQRRLRKIWYKKVTNGATRNTRRALARWRIMGDMEFTPPGPGVWELEQQHFSRPATRYGSAIFPRAISKGFGEGTRRYGLLLDTLEMRVVNGFVYSKFCPVGAPGGAKGPPPRFVFKLMTWFHPEIRRRINTGSRV